MLKTKKQNKPQLNRHVKAHIKQIKHIKQELKQEENKDEARTFTSKQKAPYLDFDCSSQSI